MYRPSTFKEQAPSSIAGWAARLIGWVLGENQRIAEEMARERDSLRLKVIYAEPDRMYAGMLIYADGVTFDPGAGEGVYRRDKTNASWTHLG